MKPYGNLKEGDVVYTLQFDKNNNGHIFHCPIRNLREYIFFRDNYTCQVCHKNSFQDGAILRMHHLEYWKDNKSNTPANTITLCNRCHTSRNNVL